MSCSHCEVAVSDSVTALDGVAEATADATAGTLTVSGRFDDRSIAEAVHAVGYELKR